MTGRAFPGPVSHIQIVSYYIVCRQQCYNLAMNSRRDVEATSHATSHGAALDARLASPQSCCYCCVLLQNMPFFAITFARSKHRPEKDVTFVYRLAIFFSDQCTGGRGQHCCVSMVYAYVVVLLCE